MLDIQFIRDHADELKTAISNKQMNPDIVNEVLRVDEQRRELITKVEELRKQSNEHVKAIKAQGKPTPEQIEHGKELKRQLQDLEPQLRHVEETYTDLMLQVPNPAAPDVPVGPDESGNVDIMQWGEKRHFDFEPKTHDILAENLDLFDAKRGVRIAGRRAFFLKNDLVLLEMAVQQFALKHMIAKGFTPMTVPWMVNDEAMVGTGYFPWGKDDHYKTQDGQSLIGTAEVSLTAYLMGETVNEKDLPIKMVGISPCFRREVGSYGKDTQGFFRVHQFQKIEQVVYTIADEQKTRAMHDAMRLNSEELLQALNLPYRILLMCTGDIGAGQRKKYDIETWFPGQNAYRETHSDSYFNDFQARRLNIRYRAKDNSLKYVYTLNNTVAATPRLLGAILENYQQADGSIEIPKVLREFMGKDKITTLE